MGGIRKERRGGWEEGEGEGGWEEEIRDRWVLGLSRYSYFLKAFTVSGKRRLDGLSFVRIRARSMNVELAAPDRRNDQLPLAECVWNHLLFHTHTMRIKLYTFNQLPS
jgi:hypothetical protein